MEDMLTILKDARDRISDEDSWCQEAYARDLSGSSISWDSEQAVQWCASGSLRKSVKTSADFYGILETICRLSSKSIAWINDIDGHEAVLAYFDRAIKELEEKQP